MTNARQLQNATALEVFKPSANQEKWLDTAIQSENDTIAEIAKECNIDRTQWYRWLKESGFIEWYKVEWDRRLISVGPKLDMIGLRNAKRDFKFWESMQRRVGNLSEGKGNVLIQQNFGKHIESELKEFE